MKLNPYLERSLRLLGLAGLALSLFSGCIVVDHHHHDAPPPPVVRADVIVH